MLGKLYEMRVQFHRIRTMAIEVNQPMLIYLAEMGIAECDDQMDRLRSSPRR